MTIENVVSLKNALVEKTGVKPYNLSTIEGYFVDALNNMLEGYEISGDGVYRWNGDKCSVELAKTYHPPTGVELFNKVAFLTDNETVEEAWALPNNKVDTKFYLDHLQVLKDFISSKVVAAQIGESEVFYGSVLDEMTKLRLIHNTNGTWGFTGRVPYALGYERADGKKLTEPDISELRDLVQHSVPRTGKAWKKYKVRVFKSEDDAKAAEKKVASMSKKHGMKKENVDRMEDPMSLSDLRDELLGKSLFSVSMDESDFMDGDEFLDASSESIEEAENAAYGKKIYKRFKGKIPNDVTWMIVDVWRSVQKKSDPDKEAFLAALKKKNLFHNGSHVTPKMASEIWGLLGEEIEIDESWKDDLITNSAHKPKALFASLKKALGGYFKKITMRSAKATMPRGWDYGSYVVFNIERDGGESIGGAMSVNVADNESSGTIQLDAPRGIVATFRGREPLKGVLHMASELKSAIRSRTEDVELDESFEKGQRVSTPMGPGSIVYQRMGPPNYNKPTSVSVLVDKKRNKPGYSGTMFRAKDVKLIKEDVELDEAKPGGVVDNVRQAIRMKLKGASDKQVVAALKKRGADHKQALFFLKRAKLQAEDVELDEGSRSLSGIARSIRVTVDEMETDPDFRKGKSVVVGPYVQNMRASAMELKRLGDVVPLEYVMALKVNASKAEKIAKKDDGKMSNANFKALVSTLKRLEKRISGIKESGEGVENHKGSIGLIGLRNELI